MKIKLCFIGSLPPVPPAYSGVADYNYSILTELSKYIDVTCLVDRDYVDLPKNVQAYNINSYRQNRLKEFDLIHFQFNNNPFITSIIRIFKESMGYEIPKVSTFHDLRLISLPTLLLIFKYMKNLSVIPSILKGNLLKLIIENSNKILVHSNYAKNVFIKNYKNLAGKIEVIPHGIYTNNSRMRASYTEYRKMLSLDDDDFVISSLGYISPRKGYEEVLKALRLLKARGVKFKYLLIGESFHPYKLYLMLLIKRYGIGKNVRFVGFIKKEDLTSYLRVSDIIIQPRKRAIEGVSGALLYAISSGIPVIASNRGYFREYVIDHKTGLLVNHNSEAIYNRIMELYSDSNLRRKIGENAYKWCRENVSWETIVKKHIKLYEALISEKLEGST